MDFITRSSPCAIPLNVSMADTVLDFRSCCLRKFWPRTAVLVSHPFSNKIFLQYLKSLNIELNSFPIQYHNKNVLEFKHGIIRSNVFLLTHVRQYAINLQLFKKCEFPTIFTVRMFSLPTKRQKNFRDLLPSPSALPKRSLILLKRKCSSKPSPCALTSYVPKPSWTYKFKSVTLLKSLERMTEKDEDDG